MFDTDENWTLLLEKKATIMPNDFMVEMPRFELGSEKSVTQTSTSVAQFFSLARDCPIRQGQPIASCGS